MRERNSHAPSRSFLNESPLPRFLSTCLLKFPLIPPPPLSTIVSRFNKLPPLAAIVYAPYRGSRRFIYRGQNLIVVPLLRKDANERETSSGKHGYTDTRPRYLYNLFVYLSGAYTTDTGHVAIMDAGERDGIHLIKRTIE